MKLLLDQGLPRSAAALLCEAGIDTIHVSDIGYATATDADILEKGRQENRIIVTLDADFHALLALTEAPSPSVIRIRIEGLRAPAFANLMQQVVASWPELLKQGAVLSVQQDRVRVRLLPLA